MNKLIPFFLVVFLCLSCSKSDDENSNSSGLEIAFNKLKSGIVGTWQMDGYYRSETSSAYLTLGWDDDVYWWKKEDIYKLTFTDGGEFVDNAENKSTYSIYVDKNVVVDHTSVSYGDYWPFDKGAIYLKLNSDTSPFYYNPYYAEIKNDGRLYLYNTVTTLGGKGKPKYRFKKQ